MTLWCCCGARHWINRFCGKWQKRRLIQKQSGLCPHPSYYLFSIAKCVFRQFLKKGAKWLQRGRVCLSVWRETGGIGGACCCWIASSVVIRMGGEEWDKDCKCSEDVTTTPPFILPCGHKEIIHWSVICQTLPDTSVLYLNSSLSHTHALILIPSFAGYPQNSLQGTRHILTPNPSVAPSQCERTKLVALKLMNHPKVDWKISVTKKKQKQTLGWECERMLTLHNALQNGGIKTSNTNWEGEFLMHGY